MMTVLTDVNDMQLYSHVLVSVFKRSKHERIRNQQNKLEDQSLCTRNISATGLCGFLTMHVHTGNTGGILSLAYIQNKYLTWG